jgi:hypothetical protein
MDYEGKLELVRQSYILYCKECVSENWDRMFDMWLGSGDAAAEFGEGYQNKVKEQFSQYVNSEIEGILYFAGRNIVYVIEAFMSYNDDADLDEVLEFMEHFISAQFNGFDNWCDLPIPSEDLEGPVQTNEDNPS